VYYHAQTEKSRKCFVGEGVLRRGKTIRTDLLLLGFLVRISIVRPGEMHLKLGTHC